VTARRSAGSQAEQSAQPMEACRLRRLRNGGLRHEEVKPVIPASPNRHVVSPGVGRHRGRGFIQAGPMASGSIASPARCSATPGHETSSN
jgi:hypothetical protein